LQHPAELACLLADPSLLPSAIDEMLRFAPPVVHFRRTATRDIEFGGRQIKAGAKLVVYHAAANRDPAVFDDPDRFDITRSPNDHLSFGAGPHFCLGSHVAHSQMNAMFEQVLWRMEDLALAGEPERMISNFQSGFKHLPIRWTVT
jgi:cytochrome P450